MKTEIQKSISEYVELYDAIQEKAPSNEVAIAILQEVGKDKRTAEIAEVSSYGLATEKQKKFLKDLGVEFDDSITKKEASDLIEQNQSC